MFHVILLIIAIQGQPERISAVLTDKPGAFGLCNQMGTDAQSEWAKMFHRQPKEFSYRCVPGTAVRITPEIET